MHTPRIYFLQYLGAHLDAEETVAVAVRIVEGQLRRLRAPLRPWPGL
jgi:hypothetical protein